MANRYENKFKIIRVLGMGTFPLRYCFCEPDQVAAHEFLPREQFLPCHLHQIALNFAYRNYFYSTIAYTCHVRKWPTVQVI